MSTDTDSLKWDKTLKVGDIITAYRAGVHRIVRITQRCSGAGYSPLIEYEMYLNAKYQKTKRGRYFECCASYCQKVTMKQAQEWYSEESVEVIARFKRLYAFLEEQK